MRNIQVLQSVAPFQTFEDFIEWNAQSVWGRARSGSSSAEAVLAALGSGEEGMGLMVVRVERCYFGGV